MAKVDHSSQSSSPRINAVVPSHYRWMVLLVSFTILTFGFSFGLFSLPVFYPTLARTFGWNHASVAAGGSIVLLLIGGFAPVVGWLVDKYSAKSVLIGGMCVVAAGLALLSTTKDQGQYYIFCTVLGVGISAVSILPNSILIAPWFTKRGIAVGVINAGIGVGGFVAPMLTNFLISHHGSSAAFLFLASLLSLPLALTLLVVEKRLPQPAQIGKAGRGDERNAPSLSGKRARFWLLGLSLFCAAHAMLAVQQHVVLFLTGKGVTPKSAALALSIILGASALGKILCGAVSDVYSAHLAHLLAIVLIAAGMIALLAEGAETSLLFMAVFGLGYGGIFNSPPTLSFELFGTERIGKMLGLMLLFFGAGTSTGGLLAGYIFDRTHQYSSAFSLDLFIAVVALVLALLAQRPFGLKLAAPVPERPASARLPHL